MRKPSQNEIDERLRLHASWLCHDAGGVQLSVKTEDWSGANLAGADLRTAIFMDRSTLECAHLSDSNLSQATFSNVNLRNANFERAHLPGSDFHQVDLRKANFSHADMKNVELEWANLERAQLILANLKGAKLQGAKLKGAKLQGVNLEEANLLGANLICASLISTDLNCANLQKANLTKANLEDSRLFFANFKGANLSHANLNHTNLIKTILLDTNLRHAKLPSPTMMLLAHWGKLSPELTSKAMAFDASCHPNPNAFTKWAHNEGPCPYHSVKVERACNFSEREEFWDPDMKAPSAYDLMVEIIKEKCFNSDFHGP